MRPSLRAAAIAWTLVGIAASVHVVLSPERHNLWPVFREGALGWWNGRNIYVTANYFRYSPAFAVLLAPFAALPAVAGNVLFDLGGLALLFHAIRRLSRVVFPAEVLSRNEAAVLLLSLIGVLRSVWSSQAHTWSAAFVFLAAAALVEERWWVAAFALALAVHVKLTPIVLAGVVVACWPRAMTGRLAAALASFVPLPLLRGRPGEAVAMYREWLERLRDLAARRFPSFRDLRHIFEIAGVEIRPLDYRVLQAVGGLGLLIWTWRLRRRGVERTWLVSGIFALTVVVMLVLGPAVEFVQYPLLAPWVSAALLAAWPRPRERLVLGLVFVSTMIVGFGAVEDTLTGLLRSNVSEALITLGTLAFGAWVVRSWRHAPTLPGQAQSDRLRP